jgi:hypothetical protein
MTGLFSKAFSSPNFFIFFIVVTSKKPLAALHDYVNQFNHMLIRSIFLSSNALNRGFEKKRANPAQWICPEWKMKKALL